MNLLHEIQTLTTETLSHGVVLFFSTLSGTRQCLRVSVVQR